MNLSVVGEKCWTAFYRETKDERDQKVFSSWSTCTTGGAGSEGSGVIVVRVVVSQVICVFPVCFRATRLLRTPSCVRTLNTAAASTWSCGSPLPAGTKDL